MSQSSQQKLLALATVAIIALLGLSAFLIYTKVNQDKLIKSQSAELIEETKVRADLEKEYYQALSDLEEMRGDNTELNAMIETQKAELKKQKDKIDGLIQNTNELGKAREEISRLRNYVTEVENLKKEIAVLRDTNVALASQRDELVIQVQQERLTNEELATAQAELSTQFESLHQEKEVLARKVDVASSIKVTDFSAKAYKVRSSGKEADSKKANRIDGIELCFFTTSNVIVSDGMETFYIRVINPLGEVMAIQDLGSGYMTLSSGESIQYTQAAEVEYGSEPVKGCINWQPGITFEAGTYQVEIFNKGFLAGKGSFKLN